MDAKQAAERVYTAIKYNDGKEFWIKEEFGELMYRNHELLKKLSVSSEGLDKAVEKARTYGMLGAKLSGGGGGGIAIILADEGKEGPEKNMNKRGWYCDLITFINAETIPDLKKTGVDKIMH